MLVPTTATRRTSCSWVTVQSGCARFCWQPACEKIGFFRIQAQFPPSEKTFDQFSNGRSGYRAQYYLSPEEGVLYDRDVTQALIPVLADARARQSLPDDLGLVIASVDAPHAKVWVCGDHVLEMAEADSLNPPRWVHNNARLGRRAPRPSEPRLELKGAFIHPRSRELFVDELKADRACDLFGTGYTQPERPSANELWEAATQAERRQARCARRHSYCRTALLRRLAGAYWVPHPPALTLPTVKCRTFQDAKSVRRTLFVSDGLHLSESSLFSPKTVVNDHQASTRVSRQAIALSLVAES